MGGYAMTLLAGTSLLFAQPAEAFDFNGVIEVGRGKSCVQGCMRVRTRAHTQTHKYTHTYTRTHAFSWRHTLNA